MIPIQKLRSHTESTRSCATTPPPVDDVGLDASVRNADRFEPARTRTPGPWLTRLAAVAALTLPTVAAGRPIAAAPASVAGPKPCITHTECGAALMLGAAAFGLAGMSTNDARFAWKAGLAAFIGSALVIYAGTAMCLWDEQLRG